MAKSRNNRKKSTNRSHQNSINMIPKPQQSIPVRVQPTNSLLDKMVDGREFESLLQFKAIDIDLAGEIRKAIGEIQKIRNRPLICYLANVVNPNIKASISIDNNDDLPFSEMIDSVPNEIKEIDIMIVTPGGSGQQIAKFVDKLRPRFDKVSFIIPNMAMSAGTIFVMSGDEIIMSSMSYIGPIDPQIPNKDGFYMPAQAILTLIDEIQKRGDALIKRGQNPLWTDLQILKQIDGKEIGNAMNASQYSVELVENFLYRFKFKTWNYHSDRRPVTDAEKRQRAHEIAMLFCDHGLWKTHSRGINREVAWDICKLKITHSESVEGLERAVRRFWALTYWVFENSGVFKILISDNYCIFRHDLSLINSK